MFPAAVRSSIGVKRMGELDHKAFTTACKEKITDAEELALVCSKWEDEIRQPEWHPFKVIDVDGDAKVLHFLTLYHNLFQFYVVYCGGIRKQPFHYQPLNNSKVFTIYNWCEVDSPHVSPTFDNIPFTASCKK
jgi:hypothetical protein